MHALELLMRLNLYIQQPYMHKVKYYSALKMPCVYSTRFRGAFRECGNKANTLSQNIDRVAAKQNWTKLIFKIYQSNSLKCPECGGELKLSELILIRYQKSKMYVIEIAN